MAMKGSVTDLLTRRTGHVWTRYEELIREATASAERGDFKSALIGVAYASTLPDSQRPDELSRRHLFREFTDAARVFDGSRTTG